MLRESIFMKTQEQASAFKRILSAKVSLPVTVLTVLIILCGAFISNHYLVANAIGQKNFKDKSAEGTCVPRVNMLRLHDFTYTHPIVLADFPDESATLQPLKAQLQSFIQDKINSGQIKSASIYLRTFNDGNWMTINDGETYSPGSLMKLVGLITYLKKSESYPSVLNKQLFYKGHNKNVPSQTYDPSALLPGTAYTIKQLLFYMIAESDNDATELLNNNLDTGAFKKVFMDLGLSVPVLQDRNYQITAREYAKFFRVLYNATYLNATNSEYALELLTKSTFKKGMVKDLPPTITVAHKFGEASTETLKQLHETGIVFSDTQPYLLTIMIKGDRDEPLPGSISDISKFVFDQIGAH